MRDITSAPLQNAAAEHFEARDREPIDDLPVYCDECGGWMDKADAVYTTAGVFCEKCDPTGLLVCEECGAIDEYISGYDGVTMCENCRSMESMADIERMTREEYLDSI